MDQVKCGICGHEGASKKNGEPRKHACRAPQMTDTCEACQQEVPLRDDGVLMEHRAARRLPSGAWAYLTRDCDGSPVSEAAPTVDTMDDTQQDDPFEDPTPVATSAPVTGSQPEPDPFEDPTPPRVPSDSSGDRTYKGRYLVPHAETGERVMFKNGREKGFTRVSTFIKAATDGYAISQWGKHNVVIGASMKPSIAARAYGLKNKGGPDGDWGTLEDLVEELSKVAGSKDAADRGTDIHAWAEKVDKGLDMEDVPALYRELILMYREELASAGFRALKDMTELTTMTTRWGGVVGTFDNVLFREHDGTYVIADKKTGKSVDEGWDEIQCQLAIYADGLNRYGVWDWDAKEWVRDPLGVGVLGPDTIRQDYGVVIHMPAEGPLAGTVRLLKADLERGRVYGEECHRVRTLRSEKVKPALWDELPTAPAGPETAPVQPTWAERFAAVSSPSEARDLWDQAKAAGLPGSALDLLVKVAMEKLSTS